MAYGDEQSIRILPSQSTVMKRNVGSTRVVHHGRRDPVARDDRLPVADAGAAERIHADAHAGAADDRHVDRRSRDRRHRA